MGTPKYGFESRPWRAPPGLRRGFTGSRPNAELTWLLVSFLLPGRDRIRQTGWATLSELDDAGVFRRRRHLVRSDRESSRRDTRSGSMRVRGAPHGSRARSTSGSSSREPCEIDEGSVAARATSGAAMAGPPSGAFPVSQPPATPSSQVAHLQVFCGVYGLVILVRAGRWVRIAEFRDMVWDMFRPLQMDRTGTWRAERCRF